MKAQTTAEFKKKVRRAVADYMRSEGCSCCRDIDGHRKHEKTLAKLLEVPMHKDGSGYDFGAYTTKRSINQITR